jgi:hypothetical protein
LETDQADEADWSRIWSLRAAEVRRAQHINSADSPLDVFFKKHKDD